MSYYDDASLVVIPSGYKTSKVYAEKPTDGSGDLTFTRTGDTATRVNSAGLVEKVRTNLALNSEGNVSTYNTAINITNATSSFNSFANAIQIPSTGTSVAYKSVVTTAQPYSISVYIKMDDNSVPVLSSSTTSGNVSLIIAGSFATDNLKVESVGNNVYRLSGSAIGSGASNNNGVVRYDTQTLKSFKIAGIQLTVGDVATDYIKTTTAAVSVGPTANTARLDYLGSTCPRLLLEPQRSNLITFSEQPNNAAWFKTAAGTGVVPVVTANDTTSPDGYQNADKIVFNSGAGTTSTDQSLLGSAGYSITNGTAYTVSFYAKGAVGGEQLAFRHSTSSFTKITLTTSWQRYTLTHTATLTGTSYFDIGIRRGLVEPLNSSATVFIWGTQVEAGAYATSYIPTLAASATRGADIATKTGITSLIGQTEGTIFVDFQTLAITSSNQSIFGVETASTDIVRLVQDATTANLRGQVYLNTGGTNLNITTTFPLVVGTRYKAAFAYKSGSFAIYVNGTSVATSTAAVTFPTLSAISLNNYWAVATNDGGRMTTNQAILFKTRLTNAELAELTTL